MDAAGWVAIATTAVQLLKNKAWKVPTYLTVLLILALTFGIGFISDTSSEILHNTYAGVVAAAIGQGWYWMAGQIPTPTKGQTARDYISKLNVWNLFGMISQRK